MVHCSSEITTRVWAVWVCCCGADGDGVGVVAWWLLLVNAGGALTMERWFGCCFCGDLGDVSATEPLLDGSVWLECFVSCFFVSAVVSSSKLHFGGPVAFLLPSLSSLSHHSFSLQFSVTSSIHLDICLIVGFGASVPVTILCACSYRQNDCIRCCKVSKSVADVKKGMCSCCLLDCCFCSFLPIIESHTTLLPFPTYYRC